MQPNPKHISSNPSFSYAYSICTLVTNWQEYEEMKESFVLAGFDELSAEYLVADNTHGNSFNAYEAINQFMQYAQGAYSIIVHQDVRCIDSKYVLDAMLKQLTEGDKQWMVCGNAGANGYHREYAYMVNAGKAIETAKAPVRVTSLDENFLVLNNRYRIGLSYNIGGFHFYGTDICMHAAFAGLNCYVIPFKVNHLSLGNLTDLEQSTRHFLNAYGEKLSPRFVQTTCTKFYLSGSGTGNSFFNSAPVFFFVKAWQRIKGIFKKS